MENIIYSFFIFYVVLFLLSLVTTTRSYKDKKKMGGVGMLIFMNSIVSTGVVGSIMILLYLMSFKTTNEAFNPLPKEPGWVMMHGYTGATTPANNAGKPFSFIVHKRNNPNLMKIFSNPNKYDFKLRWTDKKFFDGKFNEDQKNVMTQTNTRENGFQKENIIKEDDQFYYFEGWFGIRAETTLPKGTQFTVHWKEIPASQGGKVVGTLDSNTRNPFTFKIKKSDNPKLDVVFSDPKKYRWKLNFTDKRFFDGTFDDYKNNLLRQSSDGFNPDSLKSQDNNFYYFDSWFGINADMPKGTEFTVSWK